MILTHYRVLKKIGAGGMGEVHLAEDTKLDRKVVLKILPSEFAADPERMRRFIREAKMASAIKHPNVAHIYEICEENGVHFIAMEYVEGETLAEKIKTEPIEVEKLLNIGIQLADALEEAASHRIIHRDIKPANIMITQRGQVKLLDFGLARSATFEPQADSNLITQTQTQPGVALGTVPFMSPEQALGRPVDHRTDIFSTGVTLYQLITRKNPFLGKTTTETIDRILHDTPEPISQYNSKIPSELERIIRKCIEKDPERRYQSAHELRIDLENLNSVNVQTKIISHPTKRPRLSLAIALIAALAIISTAWIFLLMRRGETIDSIAILPLFNGTSNQEMDYLSDGITENLIDNLAQLQNLKVMSRSSVFRYKGKEMDPVEIGRALRVRAVLTGRVISHGDILTISLELVDTRDNRQIWGEQYNRSMTDLLPLQQEISQQISKKLRLHLNEPEKQQLAKQLTEDPEAYQSYLKGRFQFNRGSREGFKTGAQYFQEAIRKDPSFALAYTGLADCYNAMGVSYMLPADEIFPRAKAAADKALELDPTLAEGHIALGVYKVFYQWDWAGAGKEAEYARQLNARFAKSIELNTDLTNHFYCFYLDVLGKPEESIESHRQALELDPLAFFFYAEMGWSYYIDRKYDVAIEKAKKSLSMDPMQALAYSTLGNAYREKKMYPEAIAALKKAYELDPFQLVELGYGYGSSGNKVEAEKVIAKFIEDSKSERVDPANVGLIYISTGDKDKAFQWLEKAYEERSSWMTWLKVEPKYDPIRSDPRFKDLIHKVGLPS